MSGEGRPPQADEVLLSGQQLGQCNVEVSAAPRSHIFGDPRRRKRRVGGESRRVVEVLVAGQAAVH
jgi:hypothetical protein